MQGFLLFFGQERLILDKHFYVIIYVVNWSIHGSFLKNRIFFFWLQNSILKSLKEWWFLTDGLRTRADRTVEWGDVGMTGHEMAKGWSQNEALHLYVVEQKSC